MSEHTAGPWEIDHGESVAVRDKDGGRVCTINWLRGDFGALGRRTDEEGAANARLIASAPAYAAGVEQMLAHEQAGGDGWWKGWEMLKAAHAKATGGQGA